MNPVVMMMIYKLRKNAPANQTKKLNMMKLLVFLLLEAIITAATNVELMVNDEARLIHRLRQRYHGLGLARPVQQIDKALNVSLLFAINEFHGIEELTGTMKVTATVVAQWYDYLLRWNPADYDGLQEMPMLTKTIFVPTIVKQGNGGTQASLFMSGQGMNDRDVNGLVWVHHSGKVEAKITGNYLTACKLDLAKFPFDVQTCHFTFKPWRYSAKQVKLEQSSAQRQNLNFADSTDVNVNANPNWLMTSLTSFETTLKENHENYSAITLTVVASRRSSYYVWHVLLPSVAMAVLLLATFFMPFGPDRSMFTITLVLAMNIFQQALTAKLPVTAEVIPFARLTTLQVLLGIFVTIESAFVWWLAANDKRKAVPMWLRLCVPKLHRKLREEAAAKNLVKILPRHLDPEFILGAKNSLAPRKEYDDDSVFEALSHHASRLSLASRLGLKLKANFRSIEDVVDIVQSEQFLIWGDWLEVAQLCDLVALVITIGLILFSPILLSVYKFQ